MPDDVDPLGSPVPTDQPLYALGALVYAERGDQILLLRRAGGVLSGQWYLPGGAVEAGETPEQGAVRELVEESGLTPDGDLQQVGVYPVWQYGREWLHVSYRCKVRGEVVVSSEHHEAMWITAEEMRAVITDDFITDLAAGNGRVGDLVRAIRNPRRSRSIPSPACDRVVRATAFPFEPPAVKP